MNKANLRISEPEVIPAILADRVNVLLEQIDRVNPHVRLIHIDIMDNKFVPNATVGLEAIKEIPNNVHCEFHWMVEKPQDWIRQVKGDHIHLVHIEAIKGDWEEIKKAVKESGGRLGLAINPETPVGKMLEYAKGCCCFLVMSVHPGFSGQKYIKEVEDKIAYLRRHFPDLDIEVDGGVDAETAVSAVRAGANKLAAASAIFKAQDAAEAIGRIREAGKKGLSDANQNH